MAVAAVMATVVAAIVTAAGVARVVTIMAAVMAAVVTAIVAAVAVVTAILALAIVAAGDKLAAGVDGRGRQTGGDKARNGQDLDEPHCNECIKASARVGEG